MTAKRLGTAALVLVLSACSDTQTTSFEPYLGTFRVTSHLNTSACTSDMFDWTLGQEQEAYIHVSKSRIESADALCWKICNTLDGCEEGDNEATVQESTQAEGGITGCARTFLHFPEDQFLWERDVWAAFGGVCSTKRTAYALRLQGTNLIVEGQLLTLHTEEGAEDNASCEMFKNTRTNDDFDCVRTEYLKAEPVF